MNSRLLLLRNDIMNVRFWSWTVHCPATIINYIGFLNFLFIFVFNMIINA